MISVFSLHQDSYYNNLYIRKEMEIVEGLPKKSDFDKYLSVLEKTVAFVNGHRFYVDLNLCFGLFLINGKYYIFDWFVTFQS